MMPDRFLEPAADARERALARQRYWRRKLQLAMTARTHLSAVLNVNHGDGWLVQRIPAEYVYRLGPHTVMVSGDVRNPGRFSRRTRTAPRFVASIAFRTRFITTS